MEFCFYKKHIPMMKENSKMNSVDLFFYSLGVLITFFGKKMC